MDHEENLTPYGGVNLRAPVTKKVLGKALQGFYAVEDQVAVPDHLAVLLGKLAAQERPGSKPEHPPPDD